MRRQQHDAPTVDRRLCRYGCGSEVDSFVDPETGLRRQLETRPIPSSWDLADSSISHRIWRKRSDLVGWHKAYAPRHGDGELRITHLCPGQCRECRRFSNQGHKMDCTRRVDGL